MFKFKQKITGLIGNDEKKDVKTSNFWRALEMLLINCKTDLILTWSANCFIIANAIDSQVTAFAITEAKRFVPVVTLSTQDNVKLLDQLNSSFKIKINWNKYQSKTTKQAQNKYLDYLIDPSSQETKQVFYSVIWR